MDFWDVVEGRRSIRSFTSQQVAHESLARITRAGALAPSSMNLQPWTFHVCEGEARQAVGMAIAKATVHLDEYMEVLGEAGYDEAVRWYSSLGGAPALIAVSTPESPDGFEWLERVLSLGCAVENVLLATHAEGLGACVVTIGWWVRDDLKGILGIPADEVIAAVIAVGHRADAAAAEPVRRTESTVWHP
jgi:nitroreductase